MGVGQAVPAACPAVDEGLEETLPPDPALRIHELDNGLRVWIYPNGHPPGRVYLWLHIASGSLNESEAERGLAHLLEHMAFRGSAHFPDGSLFTRFEEIGMTPGAHVNGFTGYDSTTYVLTLPDARPATLELGLLALSDFAFRLNLDQQALERERDIVLEEKRSKMWLMPERNAAERKRSFLLSGSRYAERSPIGTETSLRSITLPQVQAFYRREYRPDKATLLAVGAVEPEVLLPRVQALFGAWQKPAEPASDPEAGLKPYHDTRALVLTDPEAITTRIELHELRKISDFAGRPQNRLRWSVIHEIARNAISRRLYRRAFEGGQGPQSASYWHETLVGSITSITWSASDISADWRALLAFLIEERRRLQRHGLAAAEIEEQRRALRARFEEELASLSTVESGTLIAWLHDELDSKDPPSSPKAILARACRLLDAIDDDEINGYVRALTASAGERIVLVLPERQKLAAPSESELLAAAAALAERLRAPQKIEPGLLPALLAEEPRPGKIKQRHHHPALEVTSLLLDNGVRLHLRPMREEKNQFVLEMRLAGGRIEETSDNLGLTHAAVRGLWYPATYRLRASEFKRLLAERGIHLFGMMENDHLELTASATSDRLEQALQAVYALLTEARIDERVFERWQKDVNEGARRRRQSPFAQAVIALRRHLSGGDPRLLPIEPAHVERITLERAQAWLERLLRQAPLEAALVGDFDLETAITLAQQYLGALPARPADIPPALAARRRLAATPLGPVFETVSADTDRPVAEVFLVWRGADWSDANDRRALALAAEVLERRLTQALREERGWVYGVECRSKAATDYYGYGQFEVYFTIAPERAREALALAQRLIETFAAEGPTEKELVIVRRQLAMMRERTRRQIDYWANLLSGLHARGDSLETLDVDGLAYERLGPNEVRKALARYIVPTRRVAIIGLPRTVSATAVSDAAAASQEKTKPSASR
jgi:zinc protease